MLHDYTKVSVGSLATIIMDGADPTSLVNMLYDPPPMPYDTMYRFAIQQGEVQNRSGGAEAFVGIGARLHKRRWRFGSWTDATTTFTDKTSQAQEIAVSDDVPLETTTNNDGFVAAALDVFNIVNLYVSTASVGAPVRVLEYTKADGTWGSITNAYVPPPSGAQYTITGSHENAISFEPPLDWDKAIAAHGTNIPVGYFCIRVRATTAPGTAGLARSVTIAMALLGVAGLGNTNLLVVAQGSGEHCFSCLADGLVMFNPTPAAQCVFRVNVRSMG